MRKRRSDRGASTVEYALLVAFIAAVAVGAVIGLAILVDSFFLEGHDAFTPEVGASG